MKLFRSLLWILIIISASVNLSTRAAKGGPDPNPTPALKCYKCTGDEEKDQHADQCMSEDKSTWTLMECPAGSFCEVGRSDRDKPPKMYRKCVTPDQGKTTGYCDDKRTSDIKSLQCYCNTDGCNIKLCKCVDGKIVPDSDPADNANADTSPKTGNGNSGSDAGVRATIMNLVSAVIVGFITY